MFNLESHGYNMYITGISCTEFELTGQIDTIIYPKNRPFKTIDPKKDLCPGYIAYLKIWILQWACRVLLA